MVDFIDKSLCKDCKFRVSRIISTEGLNLVDDQGIELPEDCGELHNEICTRLELDLDHIVLECSLYESKYSLSDYFFMNKTIFNLTNSK